MDTGLTTWESNALINLEYWPLGSNPRNYLSQKAIATDIVYEDKTIDDNCCLWHIFNTLLLTFLYFIVVLS